MPYPASDIDALINKTMDMDFTERSKRYSAFAEQYLGNATLVANMSSQMFAYGVQIINATALNQMPSGLQDKVLAFNATAGQPWATSVAPNPPVAPMSPSAAKA